MKFSKIESALFNIIRSASINWK